MMGNTLALQIQDAERVVNDLKDRLAWAADRLVALRKKRDVQQSEVAKWLSGLGALDVIRFQYRSGKDDNWTPAIAVRQITGVWFVIREDDPGFGEFSTEGLARRLCDPEMPGDVCLGDFSLVTDL
jgi:hypothetical protein